MQKEYAISDKTHPHSPESKTLFLYCGVYKVILINKVLSDSLKRFHNPTEITHEVTVSYYVKSVASINNATDVNH